MVLNIDLLFLLNADDHEYCHYTTPIGMQASLLLPLQNGPTGISFVVFGVAPSIQIYVVHRFKYKSCNTSSTFYAKVVALFTNLDKTKNLTTYTGQQKYHNQDHGSIQIVFVNLIASEKIRNCVKNPKRMLCNTTLIGVIKRRYQLDFLGLPIQSGSDSLLDTPEKRVIEWKFSELDINKDNMLRRKEVTHYTVFKFAFLSSTHLAKNIKLTRALFMLPNILNSEFYDHPSSRARIYFIGLASHQ